MVAPENALPGRPDPIPVPDSTSSSGRRSSPRSPTACRPRSSAWAASGAPSACSGRLPGVYTTAVGYAGGYTPEPDLRGDLQRPHRPHRGRPRRVRPRADHLRGAPEALLGGPRPDPGHAPGQRRRHASTARPSTRRRPSSPPPSRPPRPPSASACAPPATARSRTEIAELGEFYYAEDYHQQYLAKVPNGYCGLGGTGVSCASPSDDSARPTRARRLRSVNGRVLLPRRRASTSVTRPSGTRPTPRCC